MEWLIVIVVLALLFDYTNGFHDAANVVSTVIATRALAPVSAIVLAGVLNTIGATQISGVAHTITSGLIRPEMATQTMILCAIVGAILWNFATWSLGIPSSSSYALVGGLVGAAWTQRGIDAVLWKQVGLKVVIPMVFSPIGGFLLALCVMKGLNRGRFKERLFRQLQIGSASLVALAHGLNDAQKSMAVITLGLVTAGVLQTPEIPLWVILSCALMMGIGTATGGFRIIKTVGYKITQLSSIQGFAAEASSCVVILTASFLGMPVSSTHMIVGSVTGVGMAKGKEAVDWATARKVAVSWTLTIPGSASFSVLIYYVLQLFI